MSSLGKHLQAQGYKLLECEEKREAAHGTGGSFLNSESWFGINSIISPENGKQTGCGGTIDIKTVLVEVIGRDLYKNPGDHLMPG